MGSDMLSSSVRTVPNAGGGKRRRIDRICTDKLFGIGAWHTHKHDCTGEPSHWPTKYSKKKKKKKWKVYLTQKQLSESLTLNASHFTSIYEPREWIPCLQKLEGTLMVHLYRSAQALMCDCSRGRWTQRTQLTHFRLRTLKLQLDIFLLKNYDCVIDTTDEVEAHTHTHTHTHTHDRCTKDTKKQNKENKTSTKDTEADRQKTWFRRNEYVHFTTCASIKDRRYLPTYTTILSVSLLRYRRSVEFLLLPPSQDFNLAGSVASPVNKTRGSLLSDDREKT